MPPSSEAAARFRDLHRQGLLRLANAWDAGTARLIEQRGAAAVATTSAGLAWAQGYADGDRLDPDVLLQAVSRIARVIRVPLTVDVEGGYSDDPDSVAALVLRVVHAGAAGINLEDGAGAPDLLAAKIRAICEACVAQGADVFIHAARPCALSPAARPAQATNGRSATETGAALSKQHCRSRGLPLSDPTASGRVFFCPSWRVSAPARTQPKLRRLRQAEQHQRGRRDQHPGHAAHQQVTHGVGLLSRIRFDYRRPRSDASNVNALRRDRRLRFRIYLIGNRLRRRQEFASPP